MHGTFHTSETAHLLDPNVLLIPDNHEHRIYADDRAELYVVVDAEDYPFFSRWRWDFRFNSTGKKLYLRRRRFFSQYGCEWCWLHVEICRRHHGDPPTPAHTIADHWSGDSVDCRRDNLRWATLSMNRRNRHGSAMATRELQHDLESRL